MIIKGAHVENELYLTNERKLIQEEQEEHFESLFAEEYRQAKELGIAEGERRGYKRAQEELGSLMQLVQRLSEKLLLHKKELLVQMQPQMKSLIVLIAEKVIRQKLNEDEIFLEYVQKLLDLVIHAFPEEKVKVFVSKEDLEKLTINGVICLVDNQLYPGDCRIESGSSIVNGSIKRLLEEITC